MSVALVPFKRLSKIAFFRTLRFQEEEVGGTESNGILGVTFSFRNATQLCIQRLHQSRAVLPFGALQKIIIDVGW